MKSRAIIAGVLSLSLLSMVGTTALIAEEAKPVENAQLTDQVMPIMDIMNPIQKVRFMSFTGTVQKITEAENGLTYFYVEDAAGAPANFVISDKTYVVDQAEVKVGSVVTGFYDATLPMIMIYPPQYTTEVLIVGELADNYKVDVFDQDLVSSDNTLKLNQTEDTKVTLKDGTVYEGELTQRKLFVRYGVSTRSIPAQTSPREIIVLSTEAEEPLEESKVGLEELGIDVSTLQFVVNSQIIQAPPAFEDDQKTVMVPLRAIAEALGHQVGWDQEKQQVTVGEDISFKINENQYQAALKDGTTYVPLKFFKDVLKMNNAYVFEAQIVVDNGELMH